LFYTYNRMPQQCQCRVVRFQVGQHYRDTTGLEMCMEMGMGINQDGNGNDSYSHGNVFPSTAEENCCRI